MKAYTLDYWRDVHINLSYFIFRYFSVSDCLIRQTRCKATTQSVALKFEKHYKFQKIEVNIALKAIINQ